MLIRKMSANDGEKARALWADMPGIGLDDIDDSQDGLEKYLRRNPATCFVAERDGLIVGTILSGHDGRRGYIYHVAVRTSDRGRGIGRQLIEKALAALEQEKITKVALVVFADNADGNGFWEKMGFTARSDLQYRNRRIIG